MNKEEQIQNDIFAFRAPIQIEAAESKDKSSKFKITAYNGGTMWLDFWLDPVVVDLEGIQIPKQSIPILKSHNPSIGSVAGMTETITIEGSSIIETGKLFSNEDEEVKQIVAKAKAGFEWQASIGAQVLRREFIEKGESATVNGQEVKGPVYIARESILRETSIVTFGADDSTNVQITAKNRKENEMPKGKSQNTESPEKGAENIQAKAPETSVQEPEKSPEEPKTIKAAAPVENSSESHIQAERAVLAAEYERIAAIEEIDGITSDIKAKAIKENWSPEKAELETVKATRPQAPSVSVNQRNNSLEVLECAMRLNSSEITSVVEAGYPEQILDEASKIKSSSVRGMMEICCKMEGVPVPNISADPKEWARAAFSTVSFSNLLSNSANKIMLAAFNAVKGLDVMRKITKKLNAKDFKTHTAIRMESSLVFEELGSGGEIKHGVLSDTGYSYSVVTYGKMIGLTRQDIINDDLSAFTDIPQLLGRGAALKALNLFWALVIANTGNFFGSGNSNVDTSTAGITLKGYNLMNSLIKLQKDTYGNEIYLEPRYVVTPVALEASALAMYNDTNLAIEYTGIGTSSSKKQVATSNSYKGRFEPLSSPKLDAASTSTWYGFADPADLAAFGAAYLNGRETPVIEEVALSGEYLGRASRGYFDFGVCQLDPKAGVKMS